MAIAFVAASLTSNPTLTLPAGAAAGQVMIVSAFSVSGVFPIVPEGWTQIALAYASAASRAVLAYRVLDGTETNAGTWTNATRMIGATYSGVNTATPIGAYVAAGYSIAAVTIPALTCNQTDGTSWVVGVCGHRSQGSPYLTTIPGITARAGHSAAQFEFIGDTNGPVTSYAGTKAATVNSNTSFGFTVELLAAASGGGGITGAASIAIPILTAASGQALVSGVSAALLNGSLETAARVGISGLVSASLALEVAAIAKLLTSAAASLSTEGVYSSLGRVAVAAAASPIEVLPSAAGEGKTAVSGAVGVAASHPLQILGNVAVSGAVAAVASLTPLILGRVSVAATLYTTAGVVTVAAARVSVIGIGTPYLAVVLVAAGASSEAAAAEVLAQFAVASRWRVYLTPARWVSHQIPAQWRTHQTPAKWRTR